MTHALQFTKEMVRRIVDEFPQCIECGDNHLASHPPTYFHQSFCMRGAGLGAEELVRRMAERWRVLEDRDRGVEKPQGAKTLSCRDCHQTATGTGWVAYHNKAALLEVFPLCDIHSVFEDQDSRPHGFVRGVVSVDTAEIQRCVRADFLRCAQAAPEFRSVVKIYNHADSSAGKRQFPSKSEGVK